MGEVINAETHVRDTLPDPFDRLDLLAVTALCVVLGILMLISALVSWNVGLLMTGAIGIVWGVPKFLSFWRDEDVELPIPAVVLRIVLPLAVILTIAVSRDAWLLGGIFSTLHVVTQAYYLFVMRPK